jgi:hypothetical protein
MTNIKSYIFQFISVVFSFVNVKLTLDFLEDKDYSTWLIVASVAGLIYALDFGIGSIVRNRLARLLARSSAPKVSAQLVFTYYKLIVIFAIGFCIVTTGLVLFAHLFGLMQELGRGTIIAITIMIFVDFVTRAHHPIFAGLQQPHSTNFALALIQIFIFLNLQFFMLPNKDSMEEKFLVFAALVFGGSVLVNIFMLIRLNHLIPLYKAAKNARALTIRFRHGAVHLSKGLPFFLLQIEFAALGQMPLYFIYSNFPAKLLVEIAIADKVFAPFIILATVIMYPFWSGYTLLMHRGESPKARKLLRKQELFALICLPFLVFSIMFYDFIVYIWLNRTTDNWVFAFFAVLKVFSIFLNSIYSYFMNGVGKLRPQMYVYSAGLVVSLPLLYVGSIYQNIYICLSVTPAVLLVSALIQRYCVFKVILVDKK